MFGRGVGWALSDVLVIEVRSISSSAISWSLVPSVDVWVVEFSDSIGDCGNLEFIFDFESGDSNVSFGLDSNVCFLDGDSSILVIVFDFDLDVDVNLDLGGLDDFSGFFLSDLNLEISPCDE